MIGIWKLYDLGAAFADWSERFAQVRLGCFDKPRKRLNQAIMERSQVGIRTGGSPAPLSPYPETLCHGRQLDSCAVVALCGLWGREVALLIQCLGGEALSQASLAQSAATDSLWVA